LHALLLQLAALALGQILVDLEVGREMVAAGKRAIADFTDIRARTGMLAKMARELVGAGKAPVTAFPRAAKRPLTSMGALMGLKMRALSVALAAAAEIADIGTLLVVQAATAGIGTHSLHERGADGTGLRSACCCRGLKLGGGR